MSKIRKLTTLSLLTLLPLASFGLQRTELIPAKANTYVRISDTATFWEQLKKSSVGKLWQDEQFQNFLGNPEEEIWMEMVFGDTESPEAQVFQEQLKMLTGEVGGAY